ncbi:MAG: hypothetical protein KBD01_11425 [Acidobacteria bacterium]|nr:hypothetical protein [Acidobacteriota bacterium]
MSIAIQGARGASLRERFVAGLCGLALGLWVLALGTLLHELGHVAGAVAGGGAVRHFSINFLTGTPRVVHAGPGAPALFGPLSILLPWAASIAVVTLAPSRLPHPLEVGRALWAAFAALSGVLSAATPWLVRVRLLDPANDEIAYLRDSGMPPAVFSALMLALAGAVVLAWLGRAEPARLVRAVREIPASSRCGWIAATALALGAAFVVGCEW